MIYKGDRTYETTVSADPTPPNVVWVVVHTHPGAGPTDVVGPYREDEARAEADKRIGLRAMPMCGRLVQP